MRKRQNPDRLFGRIGAAGERRGWKHVALAPLCAICGRPLYAPRLELDHKDCQTQAEALARSPSDRN